MLYFYSAEIVDKNTGIRFSNESGITEFQRDDTDNTKTFQVKVKALSNKVLSDFVAENPGYRSAVCNIIAFNPV